MKEKQVIVIGGGPAGYVAAIRASQLGASAALVEENKLGGTCINCGCIPTKFLLHNLDLYKSINTAVQQGIVTPAIELKNKALQARKDEIISFGVAGIKGLLRSNGVEVLNGRGKLASATSVEVQLSTGEKQTINAKKIIIATGSKPIKLPVSGAGDPDILNHESLLRLTEVPKSIVIIGGGVVGVEMATILNRLGSKVSVIEMMPQILPNLDTELVSILNSSLQEEGIKIYCGARVEKIDRIDGGRSVVYRVGENLSSVQAECVAICVGQKPNLDGLGLGELGVVVENGKIQTDAGMQTSLPGVYAAGDVVGGMMLAHVAFAQGKTAAENAMGKNVTFESKAIPQCIFSSPEIASVGLTEEAAKAKNFQTKVGRFPFSANSMAAIFGDTRGLVKVIADKEYGQILGVHIIGTGASNLVAEATQAVKLELTLDEMVQTIHAHPSLSEALGEAALDVTGETIHFPGTRRAS